MVSDAAFIRPGHHRVRLFSVGANWLRMARMVKMFSTPHPMPSPPAPLPSDGRGWRRTLPFEAEREKLMPNVFTKAKRSQVTCRDSGDSRARQQGLSEGRGKG